MSSEMRLGDTPAPPSWKSKVANALYLEAKWVPDQINYFMDQLLAEHAHALAEKIRVHADSDGLDYYSPQGLGEAADLIDPEVTNA